MTARGREVEARGRQVTNATPRATTSYRKKGGYRVSHGQLAVKNYDGLPRGHLQSFLAQLSLAAFVDFHSLLAAVMQCRGEAQEPVALKESKGMDFMLRGMIKG